MREDESHTAIRPSDVYPDASGEPAKVTTEAEHSFLTTKATPLSLRKKTKHQNNGPVETLSSSSPVTERMTRMGSGAIKFKSVHDMCRSSVQNRSLGCETASFGTRISQGSPKKTRCRRDDFTISSVVSKMVVEKPQTKTTHVSSVAKVKSKCNGLQNTSLNFADEKKILDFRRKHRLHNDAEEIADKFGTDCESSNAARALKNGLNEIESDIFVGCNDSADVVTKSLTAEISRKCLKSNSEPAVTTDDSTSCKTNGTVSTALEKLIPQVVLTDGQEICVTENEFSLSCGPNVAKCLPLQGAKCWEKERNRRKQKFGPRSRQNFRCGTCKLRFFETENELKIHLECHHGGPDDPEYYRCKACDYSAPTWNRILSHLVIHAEYKARLADTRSAQNLLGKFACPRCEQCFERKVNMQNHLKKVHAKESHTCDQCGVILHKVDRKTFIRHQEKCRNVKIQCNHCQYTTNVRSNMQKHMKVHNGEGITCSTCSAVFPTRQRFRVHLLTHQVDRPRYECEYCGMMFLSEDSVKKHSVRFHQNSQQSFPCPLCQYTARVKTDLKKHIHAIHEKKYKCSDCSFSTNSDHAFEQHKAFHSSDRIFGCSVANCFYRASSAKQMSLHAMSVHHTIGKHQCPVCQKYYKKKTHLLRHLVSHTGDRPYVCQECGQTFFSHSSYYRHRRRLGHDENREGIASVPQNITIQYLDNSAEKRETANDDFSTNPELLDTQTSSAVRVFPATFYEHLLQTATPRTDLGNLLSDSTHDLILEAKCEDTNSLITYVVEVKQDVGISNETCFAISEQCIDEEQGVPYLTQNGSVENISLIEVAKGF